MLVPDTAALEAAIARALGRTVPVRYERTTSGVSGQVYRLVRGASVFYLRLAERATEHLDVDAEMLRRLADLDVTVPTIIYVEHFDPALQRSFIVMTALVGEPLDRAPSPEQAAHVAHRAGHDLALLNQVAVHGFGFIRRDMAAWPLRGQFTRYGEFVTSYLPTPWPGYLANVFTSPELRALQSLVEAERERSNVASHLAHGDFDVTPIFQCEGQYTGLIDFGEVRGADSFFDRGHFLLHDGESYSVPLFDHLYAGYADVVPPEETDRATITASGVLLGLRQLCRWMGFRGWPAHHALVAARAQRIRDLLHTSDRRWVTELAF